MDLSLHFILILVTTGELPQGGNFPFFSLFSPLFSYCTSLSTFVLDLFNTKSSVLFGYIILLPSTVFLIFWKYLKFTYSWPLSDDIEKFLPRLLSTLFFLLNSLSLCDVTRSFQYYQQTWSHHRHSFLLTRLITSYQFSLITT